MQRSFNELCCSVTACLEKSLTTCQSFKKVLELKEKLIKSCSKYHDYLESNLKAVTEYQSLEEPKHIETVAELPHLDGPLDGKYKNRRELLAIETVEEKLGTLDFYNPVCLDEIFPKDKAHRYMCLKHLKESGCSIKNVILFTKRCGPASGYTHFVLKEDLHSDTLTNRQETIHTISKSLPKCFSRAHKSKCKSLVSLLMHDKIFPAQYRTLYSELTGGCSVTDNSNSKAVDERIELILKTADESILQD